MHGPVPFPRILIEISRVPIVLIELTVRKTRQLPVEIENKIEDQEEHREVQGHDRDVPTGEGIQGITLLVT